MVALSHTLDAKWRGENGPTLVEAAPIISASENFEGRTRNDQSSMFASTKPARSGEGVEDGSILIKTSFSGLYASPNKNCDSALSEYHPEYIFLFKELMQQGWARLLLPLGVNDTVIPIYDDEPTGIISYALVCDDYYFQISDEPEQSRDVKESSIPFLTLDSGNSILFQSVEDIPLESFKVDDSTSSVSGSKSSLILDPLASTKSMHVRISFAVNGPNGKVRYTVACYYAKCFDGLRRTCCPSEVNFIRSLSRCKK